MRPHPFLILFHPHDFQHWFLSANMEICLNILKSTVVVCVLGTVCALAVPDNYVHAAAWQSHLLDRIEEYSSLRRCNTNKVWWGHVHVLHPCATQTFAPNAIAPVRCVVVLLAPLVWYWHCQSQHSPNKKEKKNIKRGRGGVKVSLGR